MFLNSGFTYNNLRSVYRIEEKCPRYNKDGEEQYYIRVCHHNLEEGKQIISQTAGGLTMIHTSSDYREDSIALKFASLNTRKEKEILDFCNTYGLLFINRYDNEPDVDYIFTGEESDNPRPLEDKNMHYFMPLNVFVYEVLRMRRLLYLHSAIDNKDKTAIIKLLTWFVFADVFVYDRDGDAVISDYECPRFHDYYCDYLLQEYHEGRDHEGEIPSVLIKQYLKLIGEYSNRNEKRINVEDRWELSFVYSDMKHFAWQYLFGMFTRLLERVDILKVEPVEDVVFSRDLTEEDADIICPDTDSLIQFVRAFISDYFNAVLHDVRPEMIIREKAFYPNLRISGLLQAMYVDLFFRITPYTRLKKCANPTCNSVFELSRDNSKKIYCSVSCAQLMAKRMQREREKKRNLELK